MSSIAVPDYHVFTPIIHMVAESRDFMSPFRLSFDAACDALFKLIARPLGAAEQSVGRESQPGCQHFAVIDPGAPLILIIFDDKRPILVRDAEQALSQTDHPQIVVLFPALRRRGDHGQFFHLRSPVVRALQGFQKDEARDPQRKGDDVLLYLLAFIALPRSEEHTYELQS